MAKLIPEYFDEETPPGERDVFRLISSGPEDWVVLHSLDLAPWNRNRRTEIDFLVIIPNLGILCIEVKSHSAIDFDGKKWSPTTIKRSPFKQAEDGGKTFYRKLKDLRPSLPRIPVVHCCVFPKALFDVRGLVSVNEWELIDGAAFSRFRNGGQFCDSIVGTVTKSIAIDPAIGSIARPLSKVQIESIVSACVPIQKRQTSERQNIDHRAEQIDRLLLEQQKPVLKLACLNNRLLVSGPAGTGKTLIAMEVARRAAEQGKRVALLCFNTFISKWIQKNVNSGRTPLPNLVVGTVHRVLSDITGIQLPDNTADHSYWEIEWPDKLEDKLTDPDCWSTAYFDYIVIDEAQDVLSRPRLWNSLELLTNPTESVSFCLFGDFENQVISDRGNLLESLDKVKRTYEPVCWELDENCRNYGILGEVALSLSELPSTTYAGYLRGRGDTDAYDLGVYENLGDQAEKVTAAIRYFLQKGFKPSEISVLSTRNDESCIAARIEKADFKLQPLRISSKKSVSYCSIHAFKGMENKVIILTDLSLKESEADSNLFYVGMTRATEYLRVMLDQQSMPLIRERALGENQ